MTNDKLESFRQNTIETCRRLGIAILPYGHGYWLRSRTVDILVSDLAFVSQSNLEDPDKHIR